MIGKQEWRNNPPVEEKALNNRLSTGPFKAFLWFYEIVFIFFR